jgi:anti-sigma factor RsiW
MTCTDATLSLGVYLVGALEPAERAEVEGHLATCAACRRQLDELAALPSVLDLLRLEDAELIGSGPTQAAALGIHSDGSDVTPSEDLYERLAARARISDPSDQLSTRRAHRFRFTRFRALTAAAAAVVVVGAGIGIGVGVTGGGHSAGRGVIQAQNGPVQMQVTLASQTAGTTVRILVSGLPEDEHCTLIAIGKNHSREQVGKWTATYSGKAQFWGSTSIPRSELASLELLGTDGSRLVTASI